MANTTGYIRRLRPMEEAFTISNDAMPLCVVCVLHLTTRPEVAAVRLALEQLQSRFPLLRAQIGRKSGNFYFEELHPVPPISLVVVERSQDETWLSEASGLVNTTFDRSGPLMKCTFVRSSSEMDCELLVTFHHAIMDSKSARLILHEFLTRTSGDVPATSISPDYGSTLKPSPGLRSYLLFSRRQLVEGVRYLRRGFYAPIPKKSENALLSLRLSPTVSRALQVNIGRKGHSLNSVLLAAITLALIRNYPVKKAKQLARVLSFVDLRPYYSPAVPDAELGCYISMLRLSVAARSDQPIWALASAIRGALMQALRNQEIQIMAKLSKRLVGMALKGKNMRLGISALSFMGKLELDRHYGSIELRDVSTYITNNRFGPQFSAFGKILHGSIGLDFTYLPAEMSATHAAQLVQEVRQTLEEISKPEASF